MRAIVTGATGFIGKWLVEELLSQQDEVIVIVKDKTKVPKGWKGRVGVVEKPAERLMELDISDFGGKPVDLFFHFAWAGVSGKEHEKVEIQLHNIEGAYCALKLAMHLRCARFINAGSIMEYEVMESVPCDREMPKRGDIYGTAKLAADFMAKIMAMQGNLIYINAVISNVFGVGENSGRFVNKTLRKMLKNEDIKLTDCTQLYDFIYISDAVKAIILAGKKGKSNSIYYIGNSRQYPLKRFVLQMKEILGSESNLLFGFADFKGISLSYDRFATNTLQQMGFKPEISFEQGIILTRNWILKSDLIFV